VVAEIGRRAPITRGNAPLGACYVLDAEGSRVLGELPTPATRIALPPGRYQVKCVTAGGLSISAVDLPATGLRLDDQRFLPGERTYALAKGPGVVAHDEVGIQGGLRIGDGWALAPELSLSYRHERPNSAFEVVVGTDLIHGPVLALAGVSLPLPFWEAGDTRLDFGLLGGGELNPYVSSDLDPALLFGPSLRLDVPLGQLSVFAQPMVLTRLPLAHGNPSAVGLLNVGVAWDFEQR
jgi:hypothetical protein